MGGQNKNKIIFPALIIIVGVICFVIFESFGAIAVAVIAAVLMFLSRSAEREMPASAEPPEEDDEPEVIVKNDIPVPYAIFDGEFDIIGCNEEFLQMMGLNAVTELNIKE